MNLVSIIVPVYNVEKFLKRCLNSLLSQTYQAIEIICVNDCSPDNSQRILQEYEKKYPDIIRCLNNPTNLGLAETRNIGMNQAKGDYLMFVDSDDYVETDWVSAFMEAVKENPRLDLVIGGFSRTDHDHVQPQKVQDGEQVLYLYASACTKMYRRQFLESNQIRFAPLRRNEDGLWKLLLAVANPVYQVIDNVGYHYWSNESSITRNIDKKSNDIEKQLNELLRVIHTNVLSKELTREQKNMVEYDAISNTLIWLFLYNKGCGIAAMKEKYYYCFECLSTYFPEYKKNPMAGFGKVKGGDRTIKFFVSVMMRCKKMHLDKALFYIRALM